MNSLDDPLILSEPELVYTHTTHIHTMCICIQQCCCLLAATEHTLTHFERQPRQQRSHGPQECIAIVLVATREFNMHFGSLPLFLHQYFTAICLYTQIFVYSRLTRAQTLPKLARAILLFVCSKSLRFRIYMEENQPERIYIISHILSLYRYRYRVVDITIDRIHSNLLQIK